MQKRHFEMVFSFLLISSLSACGSAGGSLPASSSASDVAQRQTYEVAAHKTAAESDAGTTQSIAIDAGGSASGSWVADTDYSAASRSGTASVSKSISTSLVTNPAPQAVYQTQRYAGNLTYAVPNLTPGANYNVRLSFVESFFAAAGKRVFGVTVNGIQELSNFDIFQSAGGANIAITRQFAVSAGATGTITIKLDASINAASIAGIEIFNGAGDPTAAPSATPAEPSPSPSPLPSASARPTAKPGFGPRVALGPQASITCAPNSVNLSPGQNIESVVSAHSARTAYCLSPGTYAQQSITPQNGDIYIGAQGAVLDGGATAVKAFQGTATGVTIKNLIIQNYAEGGWVLNAAIGPTGATNGWFVYNNELRFNGGVGVAAGASTIVGNYMHHNATSGYDVYGSGSVFTDNEVAFNNPNQLPDLTGSDGGGKAYQTTNTTISYNYVHDNFGPGIWEDGDSVNTTISYNDSENNTGPGIQHEVSWNAEIQYNYLAGNGYDYSGCGPHGTAGNLLCSQIFISSSGGQSGTTIDISHNTIISSAYGGAVCLWGHNRGTSGIYYSTYGPWLIQNVHVHNNTVNLALANGALYFGAVDNDGSDPNMFTSQGNSFDYDSFTGAGSNNVFYWGEENNYGAFTNFGGFQAEGQETHGSSN